MLANASVEMRCVALWPPYSCQTHTRRISNTCSTLSNWRLEFVKWAPDIKVIAFKGSPKERQLQGAEIRKGRFNVCLTTYEYVMREKGLLGRVNWQYLIVDEGTSFARIPDYSSWPVR